MRKKNCCDLCGVGLGTKVAPIELSMTQAGVAYNVQKRMCGYCARYVESVLQQKHLAEVKQERWTILGGFTLERAKKVN